MSWAEHVDPRNTDNLLLLISGLSLLGNNFWCNTASDRIKLRLQT